MPCQNYPFLKLGKSGSSPWSSLAAKQLLQFRSLMPKKTLVFDLSSEVLSWISCFYRRNSSCGKTMFSQACVKNSVLGGAWQVGICGWGVYMGRGVCVAGGTCAHSRRDGHCCGRYTSYWNAFLFQLFFGAPIGRELGPSMVSAWLYSFLSHDGALYKKQTCINFQLQRERGWVEAFQWLSYIAILSYI